MTTLCKVQTSFPRTCKHSQKFQLSCIKSSTSSGEKEKFAQIINGLVYKKLKHKKEVELICNRNRKINDDYVQTWNSLSSASNVIIWLWNMGVAKTVKTIKHKYTAQSCATNVQS